MTAKSTSKKPLVRYASLEDLPAAPKLARKTKAMSDAEIDRRAAADPDAGAIPDGFWDKVEIAEPEGTEQITLRLPRRVISHFKASGKGYQTRISRVLASYVDATKKTG